MELTIVNSNSQGNSYVLTSNNGQQLCIEAGRPLNEVKRIGNLKTPQCVGVVITHSHGDHAKHAKDFLKAGLDVYSTPDLANKVLGVVGMQTNETYSFGDFRVTPIAVEHDVPCLAFLIFHPEYGSIYFFTDAYNLKQVVKGCQTYMCECNYDDAILDNAVKEGKTLASQADRIRLSHMSLAHGIKFLQMCHANETARQIILIHGSSRHLNSQLAVNKYQQVLGVPTYYAMSGSHFILM